MAVTLTFIVDSEAEIRRASGSNDTFILLTAPSGKEKRLLVDGSSVRLSFDEIGSWGYMWFPSESTGSVTVIEKPVDRARQALAATVPTSSLSSRSA